MENILYTDNATDAIAAMNANLQEMGSATILTTSMSATQLVTALNAAFSDIEGVSTLAITDDAEDFCTKLNGNFSLAGQGVKPQYEAEVADTISKVNSLNSSSCLAFFAITDIHYDDNVGSIKAPEATRKVFDDSIRNMKAVAAQSSIDAVVCFGDMIEGNIAKASGEEQADHMISRFMSLSKPFYNAIGNHDNNMDGYASSSYNNYFTRAEMREIYQDYMSSAVFANQSYKSDFYVDFANLQIRMIVIYGNSGTYSSYSNRPGNYSFGSETREFLYSSLAGLPSGYKAIVVTHVPPITLWNYATASRDGGESGSTTVGGVTITGGVKGIINAFHDDVIVMLYGHCHEDNAWASPFTGIAFCCNKSIQANGDLSRWTEDSYMPTRNADDRTADLWDVVIVNPVSKKIDMVRFGAGADRTVHYEPIEVAAGASTTLTPSTASGGTWGLRTSDISKATVSNGVVTVGSGIASGTLISVLYKSADWSVDSSQLLTAGSSIEYWTIKVI